MKGIFSAQNMYFCLVRGLEAVKGSKKKFETKKEKTCNSNNEIDLANYLIIRGVIDRNWVTDKTSIQSFEKLQKLQPIPKITMGVERLNDNEDSSSNGLSSWYDRLRCDPSSLSSSLQSSMSSSSSRTVSECEHVPADILATGILEDGIADEVYFEGEEAVQALIQWTEKIRNESDNPFLDYYGQDPCTVNPRTAVRIDPYHGFSWNNREQFKHTWEGPSKDTNKFNGKGAVVFEDGGEICGIWRDGNRHGRFSIVSPATGIVQLIGDYKNNKLVGTGKVYRDDGTIIESEFRLSILELIR